MKDTWDNMDKGIKQIYDTMDKAIKQLKEQQMKYAIDKVSDCCNAQPILESEEMGICTDCKEHCEYVCDNCFGEGITEENVNGHDVEVVCINCESYKNLK